MVAAIGATPGTGIAVEESLIEALASRRMLLVVDNCEHVAPHGGAAAGAHRRALPGVWVLATSRERLSVQRRGRGDARPARGCRTPRSTRARRGRGRPPRSSCWRTASRPFGADFTPRSGEELACAGRRVPATRRPAACHRTGCHPPGVDGADSTSPNGWSTASACSARDGVRRPAGMARCAPPSSGRMTCSPKMSGVCSSMPRYSSAGSRSPPPSGSAPGARAAARGGRRCARGARRQVAGRAR